MSLGHQLNHKLNNQLNSQLNDQSNNKLNNELNNKLNNQFHHELNNNQFNSSDEILNFKLNDLEIHLKDKILKQNNWIGFDEFMSSALYSPNLGYYAKSSRQFGLMPQTGSDFVTAPELSPLFGLTLARQIEEALDVTHSDEIWEFGAGSGELALQILKFFREKNRKITYKIVDISHSLRAHQQEKLAANHFDIENQIQWISELPTQIHGIIIGNEVLDAMPVQLLARINGKWFERGVSIDLSESANSNHCKNTNNTNIISNINNINNINEIKNKKSPFIFVDRETHLQPPIEIQYDINHLMNLENQADYVTEIHLQAQAFIKTLGDKLICGAIFLLDYGFPENEYYHIQRNKGTLMCHRAHTADDNPLIDIGEKDITAHVNFTEMALAAQNSGLDILGYTSQAHFLMNCGLIDLMQTQSLEIRVNALKLIHEHEMGELFKIIAFAKLPPNTNWQALGFINGDRTHRL